jgi:hypothetical protein
MVCREQVGLLQVGLRLGGQDRWEVQSVQKRRAPLGIVGQRERAVCTCVPQLRALRERALRLPAKPQAGRRARSNRSATTGRRRSPADGGYCLGVTSRQSPAPQRRRTVLTCSSLSEYLCPVNRSSHVAIPSLPLRPIGVGHLSYSLRIAVFLPVSCAIWGEFEVNSGQYSGGVSGWMRRRLSDCWTS